MEQFLGRTDVRERARVWAHESACSVCRQPFSIFLWKHHCRSCGRSFCDDHSLGRMVGIPGYPRDEPQRVCVACGLYWQNQRQQQYAMMRTAGVPMPSSSLPSAPTVTLGLPVPMSQVEQRRNSSSSSDRVNNNLSTTDDNRRRDYFAVGAEAAEGVPAQAQSTTLRSTHPIPFSVASIEAYVGHEEGHPAPPR